MDIQTFIKKILPGAQKANKEMHILPSLTISQAILESGSGRHAPGNNCFGIKWTEGCGFKSQLLWTNEWSAKLKKFVKVQAKFKAYNTLAECVVDHSKLLMNKRYDNVRNSKNYMEACNEIQKAGYATDPNYSKLLISIIVINKLFQYD